MVQVRHIVSMLSAEWREQEYPEKHMDARHETQEQPRFEIELEAC